jgi:leucyl-tRNA synthetase|tara:strand:+ start:308 stop:616 length:309 start_codon:yes stop_codon:yes gene_type:complete
MDDNLLRAQINELIKDEIQEVINDYVDDKEKRQEEEKSTGLGFAQRTVAEVDEDVDELKVNIAQSEVDKLLKEYKKIKKRQKKSNLHQVKKMGLLDKHGRPL